MSRIVSLVALFMIAELPCPLNGQDAALTESELVGSWHGVNTLEENIELQISADGSASLHKNGISACAPSEGVTVTWRLIQVPAHTGLDLRMDIEEGATYVIEFLVRKVGSDAIDLRVGGGGEGRVGDFLNEADVSQVRLYRH